MATVFVTPSATAVAKAFVTGADAPSFAIHEMVSAVLAETVAESE